MDLNIFDLFSFIAVHGSAVVINLIDAQIEYRTFYYYMTT